jgi:perosamine synthetase
MPVHIFGTVCQMSALQELADKHGLVLIEDAAEAHGAEYKGRKAGSLSKIAAFSFFANKNLTTGEGGMVVTDDDDLAKACRYYKNMCFPLDAPRNYLHANLGYNYRMSNLHAALGLAQTERADYYRDLRRRNGALYRELLGRIPGVTLQAEQHEGLSVSWMNGLCVTADYGRTRHELIDHLKANQIDTRLYFNGMHRQPALQEYGCDCNGNFPVSDTLADTGFYLPSGSGLTSQDIERVCSVIAAFQKA